MNAIISKSISALAHESRRELVDSCLLEAGKTSTVFTRLYPEAARAAAIYADAMRAAAMTDAKVFAVAREAEAALLA